MADTHSQFRKYLDEIRVKEEKRKALKTSRKANRDRIRKHFKEVRKEAVPLFHGQGSQSMHSGVVPLSGDFDVDDGVYLQNIGTERSKWPTATTVHGWILAAVTDATTEDPQSRARCVRVRYAADYHVDLPVYGTDATGLHYLFDKSAASPVLADPKGMIDWFQEKCDANGQIRDLVRYFKGWRDYKQGATKPLKGVVITILVAKLAVEKARDDEAMVETAKAVANHLRYNNPVEKPVAPFEDLAATWTSDERAKLVEALDNLAARGQDALDEEDAATAAKIWQKEFGTRFPVPEDKGNKSAATVTTPSPAILGSDGRSA
jgi:hypothetical protein